MPKFFARLASPERANMGKSVQICTKFPAGGGMVRIEQCGGKVYPSELWHEFVAIEGTLEGMEQKLCI